MWAGSAQVKAWSGSRGGGVEAGLHEHIVSNRDPLCRDKRWMLSRTRLVLPAEHSDVHSPVLHPGGPWVWSGAEECEPEARGSILALTLFQSCHLGANH